MKYLGSHPGAYSFRFVAMVILLAAFIGFFFHYTDRLAVTTEKVSMQQTQTIINSSLTIVFASYAVKGELDKLDALNGGNPFVHMAEYELVPDSYRGEIESNDISALLPGWYYDRANRNVFYKTFYGDQVYYFSLVLEFKDLNGSGRYESALDEFQRLAFKSLSQQ